MTHFLLFLALSKGRTLFLTDALVSILYNLFAALEEVLSKVAYAAYRRSPEFSHRQSSVLRF